MANAKKCDRCGSFYDPYKGVRVRPNTKSVLSSVNRVSFSNSFGSCFTFDLCPSCMASTLLFMNIPKEQVNYLHEKDHDWTDEAEHLQREEDAVELDVDIGGDL